MINSLKDSNGNFQNGNECRILVCPSGFKESLKSHDAAEHIEAGILRALPNACVTKAPLVDGGEGFTEGLIAATGGRIIACQVTGPTGTMVRSHFGFLGGNQSKTAVIEMAAAAGLSLVPRDLRNPLHTTTFGVGQLIKLALDAGAEHVLLGCGDSGTCDGGVGMAQALGIKFFDNNDVELPEQAGGIRLSEISRMQVSDLDSRLRSVPIDVACNWHNMLCGPKGVARVFGPQKGASPMQVKQLEDSMLNLNRRFSEELGYEVALKPGSGASGGLGAGLMLIGAKLHPRFDIVTKFLGIEDQIAEADLIITAEGGLDNQTPYGKVPSYIAAKAKKYDIPVIVLAGTIGEGASLNYSHGIDAFASIMQFPTSLERAILDAERLLTDAAESMMRMVMIGWNVCRSVNPRPRRNSRGRADRDTPRSRLLCYPHNSDEVA